jgi:hypothetical protein
MPLLLDGRRNLVGERAGRAETLPKRRPADVALAQPASHSRQPHRHLIGLQRPALENTPHTSQDSVVDRGDTAPGPLAYQPPTQTDVGL